MTGFPQYVVAFIFTKTKTALKQRHKTFFRRNGEPKTSEMIGHENVVANLAPLGMTFRVPSLQAQFLRDQSSRYRGVSLSIVIRSMVPTARRPDTTRPPTT